MIRINSNIKMDYSSYDNRNFGGKFEELGLHFEPDNSTSLQLFTPAVSYSQNFYYPTEDPVYLKPEQTEVAQLPVNGEHLNSGDVISENYNFSHLNPTGFKNDNQGSEIHFNYQTAKPTCSIEKLSSNIPSQLIVNNLNHQGTSETTYLMNKCPVMCDNDLKPDTLMTNVNQGEDIAELLDFDLNIFIDDDGNFVSQTIETVVPVALSKASQEDPDQPLKKKKTKQPSKNKEPKPPPKKKEPKPPKNKDEKKDSTGMKVKPRKLSKNQNVVPIALISGPMIPDNFVVNAQPKKRGRPKNDSILPDLNNHKHIKTTTNLPKRKYVRKKGLKHREDDQTQLATKDIAATKFSLVTNPTTLAERAQDANITSPVLDINLLLKHREDDQTQVATQDIDDTKLSPYSNNFSTIDQTHTRNIVTKPSRVWKRQKKVLKHREDDPTQLAAQDIDDTTLSPDFIMLPDFSNSFSKNRKIPVQTYTRNGVTKPITLVDRAKDVFKTPPDLNSIKPPSSRKNINPPQFTPEVVDKTELPENLLTRPCVSTTFSHNSPNPVRTYKRNVNRKPLSLELLAKPSATKESTVFSENENQKGQLAGYLLVVPEGMELQNPTDDTSENFVIQIANEDMKAKDPKVNGLPTELNTEDLEVNGLQIPTKESSFENPEVTILQTSTQKANMENSEVNVLQTSTEESNLENPEIYGPQTSTEGLNVEISEVNTLQTKTKDLKLETNEGNTFLIEELNSKFHDVNVFEALRMDSNSTKISNPSVQETISVRCKSQKAHSSHEDLQVSNLVNSILSKQPEEVKKKRLGIKFHRKINILRNPANLIQKPKKNYYRNEEVSDLVTSVTESLISVQKPQKTYSRNKIVPDPTIGSKKKPTITSIVGTKDNPITIDEENPISTVKSIKTYSRKKSVTISKQFVPVGTTNNSILPQININYQQQSEKQSPSVIAKPIMLSLKAHNLSAPIQQKTGITNDFTLQNQTENTSQDFVIQIASEEMNFEDPEVNGHQTVIEASNLEIPEVNVIERWPEEPNLGIPEVNTLQTGSGESNLKDPELDTLETQLKDSNSSNMSKLTSRETKSVRCRKTHRSFEEVEILSNTEKCNIAMNLDALLISESVPVNIVKPEKENDVTTCIPKVEPEVEVPLSILNVEPEVSLSILKDELEIEVVRENIVKPEKEREVTTYIPKVDPEVEVLKDELENEAVHENCELLQNVSLMSKPNERYPDLTKLSIASTTKFRIKKMPVVVLEKLKFPVNTKTNLTLIERNPLKSTFEIGSKFSSSKRTTDSLLIQRKLMTARDKNLASILGTNKVPVVRLHRYIPPKKGIKVESFKNSLGNDTTNSFEEKIQLLENCITVDANWKKLNNNYHEGVITSCPTLVPESRKSSSKINIKKKITKIVKKPKIKELKEPLKKLPKKINIQSHVEMVTDQIMPKFDDQTSSKFLLDQDTLSTTFKPSVSFTDSSFDNKSSSLYLVNDQSEFMSSWSVNYTPSISLDQVEPSMTDPDSLICEVLVRELISKVLIEETISEVVMNTSFSNVVEDDSICVALIKDLISEVLMEETISDVVEDETVFEVPMDESVSETLVRSPISEIIVDPNLIKDVSTLSESVVRTYKTLDPVFEPELFHQIIETFKKAKAKGKRKIKYMCEICKQKCKSTYDLRYHKKKAHNVGRMVLDRYKCPNCELSFSCKYYYEKHRYSTHNVKKFTCKLCPNQFPSLLLLRGHEKRHVDNRLFKCIFCDREFKDLTCRNRHMYSHTTSRPFKCNLCPKSFITNAPLIRHKRVHEDKNKIRCRRCKIVLEDWQQFMEHLSANHREQEQYNCDVCTLSFSTKATLTRHKILNHFDKCKLFTCEICATPFSSMNSLNRHRKSHKDKLDRRKHDCSTCGKSYSFPSTLRCHIAQCHSNLRPFKCDICDKTFAGPATFNNHKRSHKRVRRACPICKREVVDLPSHTQSCHPDKNQIARELEKIDLSGLALKFPCFLCKAVYETELELTEHICFDTLKKKRKSMVSQFLCLICKRTYRTERLREEHCAKSHLPLTTSNSTLAMKFICYTCNQRFDTEEAKDEHRKTHFNPDGTIIKPYSCPLCDKKLSSKKWLTKHMSVHDESKRFPCPICFKLFRLQGYVKAHMNIHTGEKNYECKYCGRKFADRNAKNKHEMIHTGERPYSCNICGKTFNRKATVGLHMLSHTKEIPHECMFCGAKYRYYSKFRTHLKKHMKPVDEEEIILGN